MTLTARQRPRALDRIFAFLALALAGLSLLTIRWPITYLVALLPAVGILLVAYALSMALCPPPPGSATRVGSQSTIAAAAVISCCGGLLLGGTLVLAGLGSMFDVTFRSQQERLMRDMDGVAPAMEMRRVLRGPLDGELLVSPIAMEQDDDGAWYVAHMSDGQMKRSRISETERYLIATLNAELASGTLTWIPDGAELRDDTLLELQAAIDKDHADGRTPLTSNGSMILLSGAVHARNSQLNDQALWLLLVGGQSGAEAASEHQGRVTTLTIGAARCLSGLLC